MLDEELNAFLRINNDVHGTSILLRRSEIVKINDVITTDGKKTYIYTSRGYEVFDGSVDEILEKAETVYI